MLTVPTISYTGQHTTMPTALAAEQAWKLRGSCATADQPNDWHTPHRDAIARAKSVCATCPVLDECRDAGRDEPSGIWGGMTKKERDTLDADS